MVERRKTNDVLNFSPGPAKLPLEVLTEAAEQGAYSYKDSGISVMEMSHRSAQYAELNQETIDLLREILDIPSNYQVLFLQGGGYGQFAGVPLNLAGEGASADYFVSGRWSQLAGEEASKFLTVNSVLPKTKQFTGIADSSQWRLSPDAAYVYYCANETVHGIEFPFVPEVGDVPLVCDNSSSFLTRPIDIAKHGVVYAGAQKNVGCAGVTVVIVRDDLLNRARKTCPSILNYQLQAKSKSTLNTPPVWNVYILNLVLKWIRKNGGVKAMEENSAKKSKLLFDVIEESEGFYYDPIELVYRSRVNVPFVILKDGRADRELEAKFLQEAEQQGLLCLKGHRSVGGMRASLYNATTVEDTQRLASFMRQFLENNRLRN